MLHQSPLDTDIVLPGRELPNGDLFGNNMLDLLAAAVYICDASGVITAYNKKAVELWGREPEIGKDLWCGSFQIIKTDGEKLDLDSCPMAITLREGRAVVGEEIIVVRPDGTLRNVAPHPQPIFDQNGKLVGAINMLADITDIRNNELALRESENRYKQLAGALEERVQERTRDLNVKNEELQKSEERYHKMIEEVEDYAIILLDKEGYIQNWNRGAEKIKGYKEEEIIGKSFQLFYLPEDRENGMPLRLMNAARTNGKAVHEGWRMRKDGSRFWGSIVLTCLHNDEGNIIGFSKVTRDLTERKLAEDQLKENTSQLEFQNKELEQFAYAASHDMKEPLRKIHFYNSFISENGSEKLDPKAKEYLSRSINAVKRMSELIENLLSYSKTTSNIENFETINLNELVADIIGSHREEFDQKKVVIEVGNLPVIRGISFQLMQLLNNLVSNSIKYKHPDREVKISINSEIIPGSAVNDREAESKKKYHKISVSDNGIGFDPEYSEKIFEIFQRLNNLPGAKGSGVGLAICKKIVQNHRGFIKAKSIAGEGARFDIFMPID